MTQNQSNDLGQSPMGEIAYRRFIPIRFYSPQNRRQTTQLLINSIMLNETSQVDVVLLVGININFEIWNCQKAQCFYGIFSGSATPIKYCRADVGTHGIRATLITAQKGAKHV
jgi:hypothetical protein